MSDDPPVAKKTSILKTWCGDECVCNPIVPDCTGVEFFVYDFVPLYCEPTGVPGEFILHCGQSLSDQLNKSRRIFKVGQPNPGAPDVVTNSGLLGNQFEMQTIVVPDGVLRVGAYHYMFYAPDVNGLCYPCNIDDNSGGACNATWDDVEDVVITCEEAKTMVTCGGNGDPSYCVRWVSRWAWDCTGDVHSMQAIDEYVSHNCDEELVYAMDDSGCTGLTYGPVHWPGRGDPLPGENDAPTPPDGDDETCCPGTPCQAWISFSYDAEHCVWLPKDGPTQLTDPLLFKDPGEYTTNEEGGPVLTRYGDMFGTADKPCPATVDDTLPTDPVDYAVCEKQWNDASCGGDDGTVIIQGGIILVAPGDGIGCADFHAQLDVCQLGANVPGIQGLSYKYVTLHSGIPLASGTGAAWLAEHTSACPVITQEPAP